MENERKSIAFVIGTMIVGGVENALIELLNHFDYDRFDVDLWIKQDTIGIKNRVDNRVQVKSWPTDNPKALLKTQFRTGQIAACFRGLLYRFIIRCSSTWEISSLFSAKVLPPMAAEYDCVVAYQYGVPEVVATANRIKGQKRVLWVHGDYSMSDPLIRQMGKEYAAFHKIFCVSETARQQFSKKWPNLENRTQVFYNLYHANKILQLANAHVPRLAAGTIAVTVGRLSPEKGQQMIPKAARLLLDAGYHVFWYLVGDGPLRETMEAEIRKHDVSGHVILLGTQRNPYPYIKNCDVYVQTSLSEGWCLTVQEARILQKPIVTTPLPVMREQIASGENGLIARDSTPEALAESIKLLLDNPELQAKFAEALSHARCDNTGELQKLYDFIES